MEYNDVVLPLQKFKANALRVETKLSEMVNRSYGLSLEEIELMWRTAPPRMPLSSLGALMDDNAPDDADDDS